MIKFNLATIIIVLATIAIPTFAVDFASQFYTAKAQIPPQSKLPQLSTKDIIINTFSVTPAKVAAGKEARLTWNVSGADRVFIDNNSNLHGAEVSPKGYLVIRPLETTNYILTAYDQHMIGASAVATVNVYGHPPAPKISLKADTHSILAGDKVTLTWQTQFASTVSIDNGIGTVGLCGTMEVVPQVTTTYTLAATGLGGSEIANLTILVVNSRTAGIGRDQ